MTFLGVSSGELEIISPADKFFKTIVDDMSSPFDKIPEDKNESVDWEKKTVTMGMSGCLILETYKMVKVTITVTPKEDDAKGSHVVWTVEFEKISHDIKDPDFIIDTLVNYLKETDLNLLRQYLVNLKVS